MQKTNQAISLLLLFLFLNWMVSVPSFAVFPAGCGGNCGGGAVCSLDNYCSYCNGVSNVCEDCCQITDQTTCDLHSNGQGVNRSRCVWDGGSSQCRNSDGVDCGGAAVDEIPREQPWIYLGVVCLSTLLLTLYLMRRGLRKR